MYSVISYWLKIALLDRPPLFQSAIDINIMLVMVRKMMDNRLLSRLYMVGYKSILLLITNIPHFEFYCQGSMMCVLFQCFVETGTTLYNVVPILPINDWICYVINNGDR